MSSGTLQPRAAAGRDGASGAQAGRRAAAVRAAAAALGVVAGGRCSGAAGAAGGPDAAVGELGAGADTVSWDRSPPAHSSIIGGEVRLAPSPPPTLADLGAFLAGGGGGGGAQGLHATFPECVIREAAARALGFREDHPALACLRSLRARLRRLRARAAGAPAAYLMSLEGERTGKSVFMRGNPWTPLYLAVRGATAAAAEGGSLTSRSPLPPPQAEGGERPGDGSGGRRGAAPSAFGPGLPSVCGAASAPAIVTGALAGAGAPAPAVILPDLSDHGPAAQQAVVDVLRLAVQSLDGPAPHPYVTHALLDRSAVGAACENFFSAVALGAGPGSPRFPADFASAAGAADVRTALSVLSLAEATAERRAELGEELWVKMYPVLGRRERGDDPRRRRRRRRRGKAKGRDGGGEPAAKPAARPAARLAAKAAAKAAVERPAATPAVERADGAESSAKVGGFAVAEVDGLGGRGGRRLRGALLLKTPCGAGVSAWRAASICRAGGGAAGGRKVAP